MPRRRGVAPHPGLARALPAALALRAAVLPAQPPASAAPAPAAAPVDAARAALLYVSNRPADHPQANFAAQLGAQARTDSIFAARSRGAMAYRRVTYRSSADGMPIPAYVFAPIDAPGAPLRPAIVWAPGSLHGIITEVYLPFVRDAVRQGYVVVVPAYRGSMGFGAAHYNAIDYGGKELDDVASAADYLRTLGTVDPDRVGIMGHSHGGLITALLLFRGRTPFRVGVASAPVTNLIFRLSSSGPAYQRQFATQAGLRGLPFENRAEYVRRSPYYGVDSLRVPLYVYVATNDEDVTYEETRPLIDALRARKPGLAETKVYVNPPPGPFSGGHSFMIRVNPRTLEREDTPEQADAWARTWAFLARTLRPAAPNAGGAALPAAAPAPARPAPDTVEFPSGALRLRGLVFRPTAPGRHPAVLFLHGSGASYDREVAALAPRYVREGYTLFVPFRRGQGLSAGRGEAINDRLDRELQANGDAAEARLMAELLATEQMDDVLAALAFLKRDAGVDSTRVAVAGNSFGGTLAVFAAARAPGVRAAIASAPAALTWARAPELRARLLAASRDARVPVFLFQAENDQDLTPTAALAAAMADAGRPHLRRVFPAFGQSTRDGHSFGYFGGEQWGPAVFAFLREHLTGASAGR